MKKLLILYDYFDPAYKAGGPIRSLVNLVKLLERDIEIFILSSNQDHDGSALEVKPDEWLDYGAHSKVKYLSKGGKTYQSVKRAIAEINPDAVYINGMYSIPFVVFPLRYLNRGKKTKTVLAPRGMLQKEALHQKPTKKRIYLSLLKLFWLNMKTQWHVTTAQEKDDLLEFYSNGDVTLIGNVPSYDSDITFKKKNPKSKTVSGTVALISPMKNIHMVLEALKEVKGNLEYHLFGPVKDEEYWQHCKQIIGKLPDNIKVISHGPIPPTEVSKAVSLFDFYIQPSKSENFGHSIFEAFNLGVPVIISDQTPWKGLRQKKAGWDVDLSDEKALISAIEEALSMDENTYRQYQHGARQVAENYMQSHDFRKLYLGLFS